MGSTDDGTRGGERGDTLHPNSIQTRSVRGERRKLLHKASAV